MPHQENTIRYNLNMTLYNLCTYNKKFHVIDFSKCANPTYNLYRDRYYLSHYFKQQIAVSLSYFFTITAKNLAKPAAFIEQCNSFDMKTLEIIPSHFSLN
uniref:Uncharacterized protein n=1 Tax=Pararge aegeria TaxID=116150 RepID=S4NUE8_9NEOP